MVVKGQEEKVLGAIRTVLEYLGENPDREGLRRTPDRILRSWSHLFSGYEKDPEEVFTTFAEDDVVPYDQIILLRDIEFYSTCEHHFQPFHGRAHIAYIPNLKVIGISKLARLLEIYARRLQIQERIGNQIVMSLMKHLEPKGAACIIEASHMCMTSRGVEKQNSVMVTSALQGVFLNSSNTRAELMNLISKGVRT